MAVPLSPRDRRRLAQAHENGFLDAACSDNRVLLRAHGLWCWRMKLPMVWFERQSPRSRFGRLRLDLLTTPNLLTGAGQAALKALGEGGISPHDAVWERIPLARLERLAHGVFRTVLQVGHYRVNRAVAAKMEGRRAGTLRLVPRRRATA